MDLSKLPRLSESSKPPADENAQSANTPGQGEAPSRVPPGPTGSRNYDYRDYDDVPRFSTLAEAWISLAVGAILLLVSPYTVQWLISLISNYKPPFLPITQTNTTTGEVTEVPYTHSIFFFGHLCVSAFALVLIISGLILFTRKPGLILLALIFTVIASVMNLIFVVGEVMSGAPPPIISALAVAFGVYIALHQWRLLQVMRSLRRT